MNSCDLVPCKESKKINMKGHKVDCTINLIDKTTLFLYALEKIHETKVKNDVKQQ